VANKTRQDALVLTGGKRPQVRKQSPRQWTRAKEEKFLSTLADTCNITRACAVARVGITTVRRRRESNAAFRAGFVAAIASAYHRLELLWLERACNGTEKMVRHKDGSSEVMREYSPQLALALLRLHRDTAIEAEREGAIEASDDKDELQERLMRKLARLKIRLEAEDGTAG